MKANAPAHRMAGGLSGEADAMSREYRSQAAARPSAFPADGTRPRAGSSERVPTWLRSAAAVSWRLLAVAAAVVALLYLLALLRVVVLPVIVALLATTLLLPPVRALRRRGVPPGAAVATVMVGAILLFAGLLAAIAPSIGGQVDELGTGVQDGVRQVGNVLADRPFNLSQDEIRARIDEGIQRLRENSGPVTHGVQTGAILLGEVITGLILTLLLTFFFLKDGADMWRWLTDFAGRERRAQLDEVGGRIFTALGGYVRGIALVGLVDAILIGIALLVIGVPLVLPLMVLTFIGAFLPLIGAFLAGLAAVLIALVSNGLLAALLVLGAIILVQQVEGHLLYPLLMGRTVHLHPAVIILALGVGGVIAGIIGVFLAVPVAGVVAVLLSYVRREPPPHSPVTDDAPAAAAA
jgi:predicted PurR-regulated permease PerM